MPPFLVFTDLDGTLLDHQTYDWRPAQRALETLRSLAVPVIPVSSKTAAEIEALMRAIGLEGPWISENGSAIGLPMDLLGEQGDTEPGWMVTPEGVPYAELLAVLDEARRTGFRFRGFADMSDHEVAALTGLDEASAGRARQRHCSEPVLWQGGAKEWPRFVRFLNERGLRVQQGGRFPCICGHADKGRAVGALVQFYRERYPGKTLTTIGLGDSPNDLPMLSTVDYPVLIAPAHRHPVRLTSNRNLLITSTAGPAGWQWAIDHLLENLGWL